MCAEEPLSSRFSLLSLVGWRCSQSPWEVILLYSPPSTSAARQENTLTYWLSALNLGFCSCPEVAESWWWLLFTCSCHKSGVWVSSVVSVLWWMIVAACGEQQPVRRLMLSANTGSIFWLLSHRLPSLETSADVLCRQERADIPHSPGNTWSTSSDIIYHFSASMCVFLCAINSTILG